MVKSGKTLFFSEGNTHEGMKWTIIDEKWSFPIDITDATITCLAQSLDGSLTIINREVVPIDPTLGTCKLVPVAGEMDTPGTYKVQLHIEFVDTTETYIQNMFITIVNVLS